MIARLECGAIVDVAHDDQDLAQPGALRRAPAPLAGDDLVAASLRRRRPRHHRLHHAVLADRLGKIGQVGVAKMPARIFRVRAQELDRHLAVGIHALLFHCCRTIDFADQRGQSPPQSFS